MNQINITSFSFIDDPFELTNHPLTPEDSAKIREMISKGELDVNAVCDESSILGNLAFAGDLETVRMMLEYGADPNLTWVCDYYGNVDIVPPLMDAVSGGHLEIVKLLVDAGADVNVMNGGAIALEEALKQGYQEIFDYLAPLTDTQLREQFLTTIDPSNSLLNLDKLLDNL